MPGGSRFTPPGKQRDSLDEETTDWRAVCGKTARTVRRAGSAKADPDPYQEYPPAGPDSSSDLVVARGQMGGRHVRQGDMISLRVGDDGIGAALLGTRHYCHVI